jgi:polyketide biosynthesis acyl carrier protein
MMMSETQLVDVIAACAREVVPGLEDHAFTRADRLAELGANSLDRADILIRVLEILSLEAPRTTFAGAKNIGELADLLRERLREA